MSRRVRAEKPFDAGALIQELAKMPEVVTELRAKHVPDRGGRHCRVCRVAQAGAHVWPCTLRNLADAAQLLIDDRATSPR